VTAAVALSSSYTLIICCRFAK